MLPKPFRLPGSRTVPVLKSSSARHSPFLTLKALKTDQPQTKIGFIVSIKTCRLAVGRNKLKRQLRHTLLPHLTHLKPNYEILILAKPAILKQSTPTIKADLIKLLRSCSLLN
ncbi:MAG: ribonuclease P protein component [Patescibacteria group bacterium]|nr:ribonuclease P protein component [Patescibacteria group bacterium]